MDVCRAALAVSDLVEILVIVTCIFCNLKIALNLESLMKLGKEVIVGMFLDYKDKCDTTLMNINKELTDLRK